jgi:hypothetical protein
MRPARSRVHARELFNLLEDRQKRMSDYLSTTPAVGILAAHCRPNGIRHFRQKGSFGQNTSLVAAVEEQTKRWDRMSL